MASKDWLELGRIGSPYGIKGWVHVQSFTDPPERLLKYRDWTLGTRTRRARRHEGGRRRARRARASSPGSKASRIGTRRRGCRARSIRVARSALPKLKQARVLSGGPDRPERVEPRRRRARRGRALRRDAGRIGDGGAQAPRARSTGCRPRASICRKWIWTPGQVVVDWPADARNRRSSWKAPCTSKSSRSSRRWWTARCASAWWAGRSSGAC